MSEQESFKNKLVAYLIGGGLIIAVIAFIVVVSHMLIYERVRMKDQMQQLGLLGQHGIRVSTRESGVSGHLYGRFYFGSGSVSGSMSSERQMEFIWGVTPHESFATTLPYSMFKFETDDSKTTPTIEFVFDEAWLNTKEFPHSQSEKANLNRWLVQSNENGLAVLRVVVVRISRKDLEKEIYLPRP